MFFSEEIESFFTNQKNNLRIFNSGLASQVLFCSALYERGKSAILLVKSITELKQLQSLVDILVSEKEKKDWIFFPPYTVEYPETVTEGKRCSSLYQSSEIHKNGIFVLTIDNLIPLWRQKETQEDFLYLAKGKDFSLEEIIETLISYGYTRKNFVSNYGDFSVRGDIIDIFSSNFEKPVRIEFFGDTIDEIRLFDIASQRSIDPLSECVILPASLTIFTDKSMQEAQEYWTNMRKTGEISLVLQKEFEEKLSQKKHAFFSGIYSKQTVGIEEYFPEDSIYILSGGQSLQKKIEETRENWKDFLKKNEKEKYPESFFLRTVENARKAWLNKPLVVFEDLTLTTEKNTLSLTEESISSFQDLFWTPEATKRPWKGMIDGLKRWGKEKDTTILSFKTARNQEKFIQLTSEEDLSFQNNYSLGAKGLFAKTSQLKKGYYLPWCNVRILSEDILQPEKRKTRTSHTSTESFEGMKQYNDLVINELLVHKTYGLARFGGLHHLKIGSVANDYLLLFFHEEDKLYLPVDRLNLVQKYKGPEKENTSLDRLGSVRWANTTAKARKAIEKIAKELVEMYAFRRIAKGYTYSKVDSMYREFESSFCFEETEGQAQAVADVFRDMEKPEPMDRLVCGDVGFGKTEVAMRAAFRAVSESRQVAMLCPTTILAEQHYKTFQARMSAFPVRIALLSRFVPAKKQKEVLEKLANGEVDILIGTHRILSKDVEIPQIGLLIIDEEQRFGVKNKEKLKYFRKNIDVLALSATPIPRTLQMSLSGLRGLSTIDTPPKDRKPVETSILEYDEVAIKEILDRELNRGGQIFWVHNRIDKLPFIIEKLSKIVPNAQIGMAHGRMSEKPLEDVFHKFWHQKIDILVATSIVESGLDFPNANTLIVDNPLHFGLGQLYQIRGRVGRSERQAYACFLVDSIEKLPVLTQKRLQVILEQNYLGAGLQVAMEDLRLRGAGNILGEVQSGQIAQIGLDLFLEILEEEVQKLSGEEKVKIQINPEVNFSFSAHIPAEYIEESKERLHYYRNLSEASSEQNLQEEVQEMRDRFGQLPDEVKNFSSMLFLKLNLARQEIVRADLSIQKGIFNWDPSITEFSPEKLMKWVFTRKDYVKIYPPARLEIKVLNASTVELSMEFFLKELLSLELEVLAKD